MSERIVAIHQPNFFPWLGYFDKIRRADVFVLLDDAQYPKKGGTWCNRVKIGGASGGDWLTAPVDRSYSGFRSIREMAFAQTSWRNDVVSRLERVYARAAHFKPVADAIVPLVQSEAESVAAYNTANILGLLRRLGIGTEKIVSSSQLTTQSTSTARLIELTRAVGGTTYLSGGGAQGYQDEELFRTSGVKLEFQSFAHPSYPQAPSGEFTPGLSIIDALMHCGPDAVATWLRGGGPTIS